MAVKENFVRETVSPHFPSLSLSSDTSWKVSSSNHPVLLSLCLQTALGFLSMTYAHCSTTHLSSYWNTIAWPMTSNVLTFFPRTFSWSSPTYLTHLGSRFFSQPTDTAFIQKKKKYASHGVCSEQNGQKRCLQVASTLRGELLGEKKKVDRCEFRWWQCYVGKRSRSVGWKLPVGVGTGRDQEGLAEQVGSRDLKMREQPLGEELSGHSEEREQRPVVGTSFILFGDSKEASVAGAGRTRSAVVRDEVREER